MGTQQIINFANAAGSTINIVHQYGQINTATLQAQCKVFCKSTGALFQGVVHAYVDQKVTPPNLIVRWFTLIKVKL